MKKSLSRSHYAGDTIAMARRLLGCRLVRAIGDERVAGIIVETEAYLGVEDLGCHSARGRTSRTETMFGPPGHAYVYMIYGMYFCLNAVTRPVGDPQAVLIRAIEPTEGIARMRANRTRFGRTPPADRDLANGPGKLCQALGIDRTLNGADLTRGSLWIEAEPPIGQENIESGPRIGIPYAGEWAAKPLRFWLRGNEFVSRG